MDLYFLEQTHIFETAMKNAFSGGALIVLIMLYDSNDQSPLSGRKADCQVNTHKLFL
jgi:hypothetical protein